MPLAALRDFIDAVDEFFSNLAAVSWLSLGVGLVFFGIYLTFRSRAYYHTLRAAYPNERFRWREIWGAYEAAYGFDKGKPARGGDVIKLFLVHGSIQGSTYPAIGSSFFVEAVFDASLAIPILIFAFSQ